MPKFARRPDDAHRDLAAIGDEAAWSFTEHALIAGECGTETRSFRRKRLAGHHRLFIVGEEFHDLARHLGLHLVEGLHHLDEADDIADRDGVAFILVDRLVGRGLAVEGSGKRRKKLFGHGRSFVDQAASR